MQPTRLEELLPGLNPGEFLREPFLDAYDYISGMIQACDVHVERDCSARKGCLLGAEITWIAGMLFLTFKRPTAAVQAHALHTRVLPRVNALKSFTLKTWRHNPTSLQQTAGTDIATASHAAWRISSQTLARRRTPQRQRGGERKGGRGLCLRHLSAPLLDPAAAHCFVPGQPSFKQSQVDQALGWRAHTQPRVAYAIKMRVEPVQCYRGAIAS